MSEIQAHSNMFNAICSTADTVEGCSEAGRHHEHWTNLHSANLDDLGTAMVELGGLSHTTSERVRQALERVFWTLSPDVRDAVMARVDALKTNKKR